MSIASPKTDKEYEARWDAETLANAERIKADKPRLSAAQAAAKAIVDERAKDAQSMRKVAGSKSNSNDQGNQSNQSNQSNPPRNFTRNFTRSGPQNRTGPKGTNTNKGGGGGDIKRSGQGFNVFKRIGG